MSRIDGLLRGIAAADARTQAARPFSYACRVREEEGLAFSVWWRNTGEQELRQLLYWVWDPIELNEQFPDAVDEYDSYALEIATALASDMPTATLAALLQTIERNRMGLETRSVETVAARLSAWYDKSRTRADR